MQLNAVELLAPIASTPTGATMMLCGGTFNTAVLMTVGLL
mgnify:CR=1 FL=1